MVIQSMMSKGNRRVRVAGWCYGFRRLTSRFFFRIAHYELVEDWWIMYLSKGADVCKRRCICVCHDGRINSSNRGLADVTRICRANKANARMRGRVYGWCAGRNVSKKSADQTNICANKLAGLCWSAVINGTYFYAPDSNKWMEVDKIRPFLAWL